MSANPKNVQQPTRVTADEIIERMNRGEEFCFLDTRNPNAWGESDTKLPGALRVAADQIEQQLLDIPRDCTIITYCT